MGKTAIFMLMLMSACNGTVQLNDMAQDAGSQDATPALDSAAECQPTECATDTACDSFSPKARQAFIEADKWCWEKSGNYTDCIRPMRSIIIAWQETGMCEDSTELDDLL